MSKLWQSPPMAPSASLVVLAIGAFLLAFLPMARANGEASSLRAFMERCESLVTQEFQAVRMYEKSIQQWPEDAELSFCKENQQAYRHLESRNREFRRPAARLSWETNREASVVVPENLGTCESLVWTLQEAHKRIRQQFAERCRSQSTELTEFRQQCMLGRGSAQTECPERIRDIQRKNGEGAGKISRSIFEIKRSLADLGAANERLIRAYEKDREALREPAPNVEAGAARSVADRPKPQRGGVDTEEQYRNLLTQPVTAAREDVRRGVAGTPEARRLGDGPLLREAREAQEAFRRFQERIERFGRAHAELNEKVLAELRSYRPNAGPNVADMANQAMPLAGPAINLLQKPPATTSPLPAPTSVSPAPLPLAGALPLLAAGAAGLAGTRNGSGASNAVTANPLASSPAQPIDTTVKGSDFSPTNPSTPLPPPNGEPPFAKNIEGAIPVSQNGGTPTANPGLGMASPAGIAAKDEGNNGKSRSGPRKPASLGSGNSNNSTLDFGPGGTGLSFQEDLTPKKTDRSNTDGVGEVSSLLGQMKNLFNMDDPFGADSGNPGGFSNPFAAEEKSHGTTFASESSANEENHIDWAAGNSSIEAPPADPQEEANPWRKGEQVKGDARRPSEGDSLFQRVRLTHQRAMSKGLVVLSFGEIPQ